MSSPSAGLPAGEAGGNQVQIEESGMASLYANFARVSCNAEELIVDFGLNARPNAARDDAEKVVLSQRVIMNHFTAKRLLAALSAGLQRHEQAFGPIEIDIRKRLRTQ